MSTDNSAVEDKTKKGDLAILCSWDNCDTSTGGQGEKRSSTQLKQPGGQGDGVG